ncbi:hypothetical protein [Streptomyces sp. NPDC058394]|uniref:hypothetical protein n=1 Tax=unclassified Streptomyces TaxID=2593676 RepID=UPI00365419EC
MSLRRLGVDRIDLPHLHRVDPDVPFADQIGHDEGDVLTGGGIVSDGDVTARARTLAQRPAGYDHDHPH